MEAVEYRIPADPQPLPRAQKHVVLAVDATMEAPLLAGMRAGVAQALQVCCAALLELVG